MEIPFLDQATITFGMAISISCLARRDLTATPSALPTNIATLPAWLAARSVLGLAFRCPEEKADEAGEAGTGGKDVKDVKAGTY